MSCGRTVRLYQHATPGVQVECANSSVLSRVPRPESVPCDTLTLGCACSQFLLLVNRTITLIANQDGVVEAANRAGCWRGKLLPLRDTQARLDSDLQTRRELPVVNPPVATLVAEGGCQLRE